MPKKILAYALLITLLLCLGRPLQAAEVEENYGYSKVAMPELLIGAGTRATAMGGAGVSTSDGVDSLHWNPAGLQQMRYPEIEFIHNAWFQEMNRETFMMGLPITKYFVLGFGFNYMGLGTIEKTDSTTDGRLIRTGDELNLSMFGGSLGAGIAVGPLMSFGVAARTYVEDLGDVKNTTVLGDLGWQYRGIEDFNLGFAIKNLGMGVSGYNLPISGTIGAAYKASLNRTNNLLIALDAEMLFHELAESIFHFGLEYNFGRIFKIRTGYQFTGAHQPDGLVGLTAGLGIKAGLWKFGYTLAPQGDLGLTHRISICFNLRTVGISKRPKAKKVKMKKRPLIMPRMGFDASGGSGLGQAHDIGSAPTITKEEAAMRSLLKANVQVEARVTKASARTKGAREVHFRVKRTSGAIITQWTMEIETRDGKALQVLKGKNLPKLIRWNGRDKKGNLVKDVKGVRYFLTLTDINGQIETQKGRVGVSTAGTLPNSKKIKAPRLVDSETFGPVLFEKGRAEISTKAADIIANAATFIRDHPRTKVFIEGYADSVDEGNRKIYLSKARAEAVARYLTAYHKVPISRILVRGRGDKNPVANNLDPDKRYKNRRVVITVRGMQRK